MAKLTQELIHLFKEHQYRETPLGLMVTTGMAHEYPGLLALAAKHGKSMPRDQFANIVCTIGAQGQISWAVGAAEPFLTKLLWFNTDGAKVNGEVLESLKAAYRPTLAGLEAALAVEDQDAVLHQKIDVLKQDEFGSSGQIGSLANFSFIKTFGRVAYSSAEVHLSGSLYVLHDGKAHKLGQVLEGLGGSPYIEVSFPAVCTMRQLSLYSQLIGLYKALMDLEHLRILGLSPTADK